MTPLSVSASMWRLAAVAFFAAGLSSTAQAQTEIKVSLGVSPKHPGYSHGWEPYAKRVEAETQGDLKFRFFLGGQLFGMGNSLDGIRSNAAQATFLVLPYWPAQLPHAKFIGDMALIGTDSRAMAGATMEFFHNCKECMEEFTAQNVVYVGGYSTDPFNMLCTRKFQTVEDFKGRKIRSGAGGWARWTEHLGATVVNLPGSEHMQGLQAGVFECTAAPLAYMTTGGLWGTASHALRLPLGTFHSLALIDYNLEFWRGLKPEHRRVLVNHTAEAIAATTLGFIEQSDEAAQLASSRKLELVEPSAELRRVTAAFAEKDAYLAGEEAAEKQGIKNAKDKVQRYLQLVQRWEKLVASTGNDAKALGAIYQREIFDRLDTARLGM